MASPQASACTWVQAQVRGGRPRPPGPGPTAAGPTGRRRHAPAHHGPQWLRQEFSVPDPWRALAHLRWCAIQAPTPSHVLHPSEVSASHQGTCPAYHGCEGKNQAPSSTPAPSKLGDPTPRGGQSLGLQERTRCCPLSRGVVVPPPATPPHPAHLAVS